MYKCISCGRCFSGGERRDKSQVITDYIEGKQTLAQLVANYGVPSRAIARDLEGMRHIQKISRYRQVVIQMDTTYWGAELRADGHQGHVPQQDYLIQVRTQRDDGRLYGRYLVAAGTRFHNPRHRL
ncbi:MAG: hypothetical protein J1E58_09655 [Prevotella sp.]|nr:hypothetical protein [Prevotella sp.]